MSQMKRDNFKEEKELERQIYTNLQLPQSNIDSRGASLTHYPRNTVKTTKYTPITFIPKNIFEQFRGLANVYFAFTVVIQAIPGIGNHTHFILNHIYLI